MAVSAMLVSRFSFPSAERAPAARSIGGRRVEEEILPFCHLEDIDVIVYSMASGLLTAAIRLTQADLDEIEVITELAA